LSARLPRVCAILAARTCFTGTVVYVRVFHREGRLQGEAAEPDHIRALRPAIHGVSEPMAQRQTSSALGSRTPRVCTVQCVYLTEGCLPSTPHQYRYCDIVWYAISRAAGVGVETGSGGERRIVIVSDAIGGGGSRWPGSLSCAISFNTIMYLPSRIIIIGAM
jgi:hypothetical protein